MWAEILASFGDSPSQVKVIRFLLENGFGITKEGRIAVNGIPVPSTQIARQVGVDRRVVDATAERILKMEGYAPIFLNMRATQDISEIAEMLSLSVITIIPDDATRPGIIGAAVRVLDAHEVGIRQIFVTDPHLSESPKLVIITGESIAPEVYQELKDLPQVRHIIL
ncbi:MAG: regulator of amino acid metabolism, contains ACT domain protein [Methanospirillaceae archaeon]|nr:regulator of amino acid metabolism, contains ACT domain protein [Methanospirillaceae archaeon]